MPTYIWLFKWTEQGAKEAKGSLDRNERGRAMIEKAGGRVIGAWWTQGRYDTVLVAELPDDETASALSIGVGCKASFARRQCARMGARRWSGFFKDSPE